MKQVRDGYKMTELGEIPVEWEVVDFFHYIDSILDFRGRTPKKLGMDWGNGNIRALSANNVKMGFIDFSAECYLASNELYERWMTKGDLEKDDVLFTMEAPLGNVAQVPDNNRYILSQRVVAFKAKENLNKTYLKYFLMSDLFKECLDKKATGTTAKGISQKNLAQLSLIIPNMMEQQKISEILSTVDEQIHNTEQLIEKTKELKKGLMQQLLTKGIGHTEFKKSELGKIPVEWEVKQVGDIAKIKTGGTPSKSNKEYWENGSVRWMSSGEVNLRRIYEVEGRITNLGLNNSNTTILPTKTIMMAMNGQGKTRGTVAILEIETTCNQSLAGILPSEKYYSEFLFYYLESQYERIRNINGEGRAGLNLRLINEFLIVLPSIEEQQKIASIFSAVDEQIENYEQEKQEYLELKKGLMQQLLTGQIRVTV
ncbi:restriction endonuclease subunit S [Paenibacillus sp. Marseille-Q7038]